MVKIAGIKFRNTGKVYYFDPGEIEGLEPGCGAIVETARGQEFGTVAIAPAFIKEELIVRPLRRVIRAATEADLKRQEENESKKAEAMDICARKIRAHGLEMKLVDVEFTFDNNKIVFYFTADGRVDFRELVKDLAGVFHMRIELRQIGVRDEVKMMGGCGACGQDLCCASWMREFIPVSIKMAKNQNLSLNPSKISGICGRLMCCLKYENDAYTELRKGMPEHGDKVMTPDGPAKVFDINLLKGEVKVRLFSGEKDENGTEKLSSDLLIYPKGDVQRLAPRRKQRKDKTK